MTRLDNGCFEIERKPKTSGLRIPKQLVCPVVGFEGSGGRLVGSVAAFVCSGGGLGLSGALFLFPAEHQLNTHNIEPIESNQFNEHK